MSDAPPAVGLDRFSPAAVADPYGLYARLRGRPPFFAEAYGVWIVSRYEDVRRVLAEHGTFSSDFLIRSPLVPHPGVPEVPAGGHPEVKVLLNQDPPDHAAARAVVGAFTPRRVRELTPRVRQLAAAHSSVAFEDHLAAFLDGHTGEDLTSAPPGSGAFHTEQTISLLITPIFGGTRPPRTRSGDTLLQLIPPAGDARWWQHPSEDVAAAVAETLRHDPPAQGMYRRVVADTEVGGARIPAGAQVFALIGPAGRDGEVFPDPDRWDPHRAAPGHLAFGQGVHCCLGAQLAKTEATVAVTTLLERLPHLAGAPGFTGGYLPNLMHRGPARLPVRWRPPS